MRLTASHQQLGSRRHPPGARAELSLGEPAARRAPCCSERGPLAELEVLGAPRRARPRSPGLTTRPAPAEVTSSAAPSRPAQRRSRAARRPSPRSSSSAARPGRSGGRAATPRRRPRPAYRRGTRWASTVPSIRTLAICAAPRSGRGSSAASAPSPAIVVRTTAGPASRVASTSTSSPCASPIVPGAYSNSSGASDPPRRTAPKRQRRIEALDVDHRPSAPRAPGRLGLLLPTERRHASPGSVRLSDIAPVGRSTVRAPPRRRSHRGRSVRRARRRRRRPPIGDVHNAGCAFESRVECPAAAVNSGGVSATITSPRRPVSAGRRQRARAPAMRDLPAVARSPGIRASDRPHFARLVKPSRCSTSHGRLRYGGANPTPSG